MTYPGQTYYPFGAFNEPFGQWQAFDPTQGAFNYSISSGFTLGSVWFPVLTSQVQLFDGSTYVAGTSTPFYTTGVGGYELVPLPSGLISLVLLSVTLTGSVMSVYFTNTGYDPIKSTPSTAGVATVSASAPITSTGGANPTIGLTNPLPIVNGGTGSTSPSLIAGSNINITGAWPNQSIAAVITNLVTNSGLVVTNPKINCGAAFTNTAGTVSFVAAMPNNVYTAVGVCGSNGYWITAQQVGTTVTFNAQNSSGLANVAISFFYIVIGN